MSNYTVEKMGMGHIEDVVVIENLSFKTPWTGEAFAAELTRNKCARYWVILDGDKVAAYGGMWVMLDEAHITNIAVHPEYRGIGLGKRIIEILVSDAINEGVNAMTLEVRVNNLPALNLYKKYGFTEVAVRKNYYQDTGEDAIIMWKYDMC